MKLRMCIVFLLAILMVAVIAAGCGKKEATTTQEDIAAGTGPEGGIPPGALATGGEPGAPGAAGAPAMPGAAPMAGMGDSMGGPSVAAAEPGEGEKPKGPIVKINWFVPPAEHIVVQVPSSGYAWPGSQDTEWLDRMKPEPSEGLGAIEYRKPGRKKMKRSDLAPPQMPSSAGGMGATGMGGAPGMPPGPPGMGAPPPSGMGDMPPMPPPMPGMP